MSKGKVEAKFKEKGKFRARFNKYILLKDFLFSHPISMRTMKNKAIPVIKNDENWRKVVEFRESGKPRELYLGRLFFHMINSMFEVAIKYAADGHIVFWPYKIFRLRIIDISLITNNDYNIKANGQEPALEFEVYHKFYKGKMLGYKLKTQVALLFKTVKQSHNNYKMEYAVSLKNYADIKNIVYPKIKPKNVLHNS